MCVRACVCPGLSTYVTDVADVPTCNGCNYVFHIWDEVRGGSSHFRKVLDFPYLGQCSLSLRGTRRLVTDVPVAGGGRYACGRSGEMCEMRSPEAMASGDCARYACDTADHPRKRVHLGD